MSSFYEIAEGVLTHNFTKKVHKAAYPAISPLRPELSQAGKTVLITGGGTGIGLAIAKGFVQAQAKKVIIVGRRLDVLGKAREELEIEAKKAASEGTPAASVTSIVTKRCDVTDDAEVEALWADSEVSGSGKGGVDVLILNSAIFSEPKKLLELGTKELWRQFEGNLKGPFHMAEEFYKHNPGAQKFLVNVSTLSIHAFDPGWADFMTSFPSYGLTKNAGSLTLQLVANEVTPDDMQIVSFHPGMVYTDPFKEMGMGEDAAPFDDVSLPTGFAVWASTKEARFLHGRFVWASWDVEELASGDVAKRIEEDFDYLKVGVVGIKRNQKAH